MNQWIIGQPASLKLRDLNRKFKEICIERARSELKFPISQYTPWLCLDSNRKMLPKELLARANNILLEDQNHLNLLGQFYIPPANKVIGGENTVEFKIKKDDAKTYEKSLEVFKKSNSFVVDVFSSLVMCIVPMIANPAYTRKEGVGNSNHESIGAIYLSIPQSKMPTLQLAINISHEVGHQALMQYQASDTIIETPDLYKDIYSCIRETKRPAIQAFHALVALTYMRDFLAHLNIKEYSDEENSFIKDQLNKYEGQLKSNVQEFSEIRFTQVGTLIYQEIFNYTENICS